MSPRRRADEWVQPSHLRAHDTMDRIDLGAFHARHVDDAAAIAEVESLKASSGRFTGFGRAFVQ